MSVRSILPVVGLIIAAGCSAVAPDMPGLPGEGDMRYTNAERTWSIEFRDNYAVSGPITPSRPLGNRRSEFFGGNTHDCSDGQFMCLAKSEAVFAVPRKQLSTGMSYVVAGTVFTIKQCILGVEDDCQVALIEGDCQFVRTVEGAEPACQVYAQGRSGSPQKGQIRYFIYNEDFGVTAFGIASDTLTSKDAMVRAARDYALQGEIGLLGRKLR